MGVFDRFLNKIDTAGGVPIVSRSNPLNWTRLGQTIVFSVIATLSLAYQTVIGAVSGAYTSIITGVTEFVTGTWPRGYFTDPFVRGAGRFEGLFAVVEGEITTTLAAVWGNSFTGMPGFLALPLQTLVVLSSFWIMGRTVQYIRDEVL